MAPIKPIIKKNLIYIRRNIFKSFLQLFYPTISLIVFTYLLNMNGIDPSSRSEESQSQSHYDMVQKLSLNHTDYSPIIQYYGQIVIIGDNQHITSKLEKFMQMKHSTICEGACTIINFSQRKDFTSYISDFSYRDKTPIMTAIEYYQVGEQLNFRLSDADFINTKSWDSLNTFNINPDNSKFNSDYLEKTQTFQVYLSQFLLYFHNKTLTKNIEIDAIPMTSQKNITTVSLNMVGNFIPSAISLSYLSVLFKFVLWLVVEKEKKLKDLLARQGVTTFQYFSSWLVTFIILTIIPITMNSILMKTYYLQNTSILFIFFNLFLFLLNILAMALFFHQFVNDVRSGQSLMKVFYIGVSILSLVVSREETNIVIRYMFNIFPQTVLKTSFDIFLNTRVIKS